MDDEKVIQPFQERMFKELKELNERKSKLYEFISNNENFKKLSEEKQKIMNEQLDVMQEYENILTVRLELEGFSDKAIFNYLTKGYGEK